MEEPVRDLRLASWGDRASAFVLDLLLLVPLLVVTDLIAAWSEALSFLVWAFPVLWLYGRLLDGVRGRSPAKALMGMRVVDAETGARLTIARGISRWVFGLFFIPAFAPINYLIVPLVSRRSQTLHDMVGSAVVINDPGSRRRLGWALWAWPRASAPQTVVPDTGGVGARDAHPDRTRHGGRIVLIVAVAIVALMVTDWYLRNREMDSLLDAVKKSETAMVATRGQLISARSEYDRGWAALGCTNPTYCQGSYQELSSAFLSAASVAATDGAIHVRETGASVDHVAILPWHRSLKDARAAYVDHNNAWYRWLTTLADDPSKMDGRSDSIEIGSTFLIAHERFREAVPSPSLFDAEKRIAKIWAD